MDLKIEQKYFSHCYKMVAGVDEVGRGPLAGPVVAACVVIGSEFVIPKELEGVKDSKKLSEKKREELYEDIMRILPDVGVGICNHKIIDKVNILQATFLAMKKAVTELKEEPEIVLVDGKFTVPILSVQQKAIIKGDSSVFSIAAASIVAKVVRDRLMRKIHDKYPEYGFHKHKGYGTKFHIEALKKYGPCPIHRRSFSPVKELFLVNKKNLVNT